MSLNNFEKLKHSFYSFSTDVSKKQKRLSAKHQLMNKEHNQFKNRVNKRINSYSK